MLLQGADFLGWRGGDASRAIAGAAAAPARADIVLEARRAGARVAVAATSRVRDPSEAPGARLAVAWVDSGHVTDVRRGENAGVVLAHDRVVRALAVGREADPSGTMRVDATFDRPADAGRVTTRRAQCSPGSAATAPARSVSLPAPEGPTTAKIMA